MSDAFQGSKIDIPSTVTETWRVLARQLDPSHGSGSGHFQQGKMPTNAQWLRRFSLVTYGAGPPSKITSSPVTQGAIPTQGALPGAGAAPGSGGAHSSTRRRTLVLPQFIPVPHNGDSAGAPTTDDSTLGDTADNPPAETEDSTLGDTPDDGGGSTDTASGGIDLSAMRCVFHIEKSTSRKPNLFWARIYNLSPATMAKVIEMKRVRVSAGYWFANYGVVFDGTVTQYVRGKENPTDTFLDIYGGGTDQAINAASQHQVYLKGSTELQRYEDSRKEQKKLQPEMQIGQISEALRKIMGRTITRAYVSDSPVSQVQRELEQAHNFNTFVDDNKSQALSRSAYLPGEAVVLSPKTGLVKIPELTPQGIQIDCLLNPKLRIGGLVKIDEALLSGVSYIPGTPPGEDSKGNPVPGKAAGGEISQAARNEPSKFVPYLSLTRGRFKGTYKIILMKLTGDTRGMPWYCQLICLALDSSGAIRDHPGSALSRSAISASVTAGGTPTTQGGVPTQSASTQNSVDPPAAPVVPPGHEPET